MWYEIQKEKIMPYGEPEIEKYVTSYSFPSSDDSDESSIPESDVI